MSYVAGSRAWPSLEADIPLPFFPDSRSHLSTSNWPHLGSYRPDGCHLHADVLCVSFLHFAAKKGNNSQVWTGHGGTYLHECQHEVGKTRSTDHSHLCTTLVESAGCLAEDLSSISSTYMVPHNCNVSSRGPGRFFWPLHILHACGE